MYFVTFTSIQQDCYGFDERPIKTRSLYFLLNLTVKLNLQTIICLLIIESIESEDVL